MKTFTRNKLTSQQVETLISMLYDAEVLHDYDGFIKAFSPLWSDVNVDPDFSNYPQRLQADLERLAGNFLLNYGRSKSFSNFQERGKELLTGAMYLYETIGDIDSSKEAQIQLGIGYFLTGGFEDAEAWLSDVEHFYRFKPKHSNYLLLQVNYLANNYSEKNYAEALKRVENNLHLVEGCPSIKIKYQFSIQAGMIYRACGRYTESEKSYQNALRYLKDYPNPQFTAKLKNNLANLYRQTKDFDDALELSLESIRLIKDLELNGWLAHFYDTLAMIYFDQGNIRQAVTEIDKSIFLFRPGDDYAGYADALFNKTRFLFKFKKSQEGLETFGILSEVVLTHISSKAFKIYCEQLREFIYVDGLSEFDLAVADFKKYKIAKTLKKTDSNITAAAKKLGIKYHQTLSNIIKNLFGSSPSDRDEIGLPVRKMRSDKNAITEIELKENFDFTRTRTAAIRTSRILFYYIPAKKSRPLFHDQKGVILATVFEDLKPGDVVIFRTGSALRLGEVKNQQFVADLNGTRLYNLENLETVRKITAYSDFKGVENERFVFKNF